MINMKATNVITIPKKLAQKDDLVVLPRKEYEKLVESCKIKEFTPTPVQRRALRRAEKNLREGKTLTINELRKKLGFTN